MTIINNDSTQSIQIAIAEDDRLHKNKIGVPLIASVLSISPILIISIGSFGFALMSYAYLFLILCPIAGLIMGIISLIQGKKRIGLAGMIFAVIAVALPLAMVALILVVFIGVSTGLISLM